MKSFRWSVTLTILTGFWFGQAREGFAQTPGEVVMEALNLANAGKYSEMQKHFSEEALAMAKLAAALGATSAWQDAWQKQVRNGTLEKLLVLKEDIRGEKAEVEYMKTFKDGSTQTTAESLIKQNGLWKITIDKAQHEKRMQRKAEENAAKFLAAVRTNDFRSVYSLVSAYQEGVSNIRENNPKVLWPELLQRHFETGEREFNTSRSDAFNNPFQREVRSLLTKSVSWQVSESKLQKNPDFREIVRVYVSLDYESFGDSPVVESESSSLTRKRLKSCLLQMDFLLENALLAAFERVKAADVLWDASSILGAGLDKAIQLFAANEGRYPKDLNELVRPDYLNAIPAPPVGMQYSYNPTNGVVKLVPK